MVQRPNEQERLPILLGAMVVGLLFASVLDAGAKTKSDSQQLRTAYINRVAHSGQVEQATRTAGSLWIDGAALGEMASDYKARHIGDNVVIRVVENTTAVSTGNVSAQRSFQADSAITGLPGRVHTGGVDPLFNAKSASTLKGQGASSNSSNLNTNLSATVIALLPNSSLVVEARREIFMNSQHETMIVRGVLRAGDIGPNNTAVSSSLSNLEIELKGKGVISDVTHRPNFAVRALLWLVSF